MPHCTQAVRSLGHGSLQQLLTECLDQKKLSVLTAINNMQSGAKMLQSPSYRTPGHLQLCTTTGLYRVQQIRKDTFIRDDEIEQTKKLKGKKQWLFVSRERCVQLQGSEGLAERPCLVQEGQGHRVPASPALLQPPQSFQQHWNPPSCTQPCPNVCQHQAAAVCTAPGHGCTSATQTVLGPIREEKPDGNFTEQESASKGFPCNNQALLSCSLHPSAPRGWAQKHKPRLSHISRGAQKSAHVAPATTRKGTA